MDALCKEANIDRSHTDHHHPIAVSPDGKYSIEFAECLASCGTAPMMMVGDAYYENLTPASVDALLTELKETL
jgi:NADH-quinone oxidoreductase subunit E